MNYVKNMAIWPRLRHYLKRTIPSPILSLNQTIDAKRRNIKDGDMVRIYNDRGEVQITAKVTPRIIPGVVAMGEGAWYAPDENKVDHGGSLNVLTTQRPSPLAKGNPQHSNLVEVARV